MRQAPKYKQSVSHTHTQSQGTVLTGDVY
jgi:hypothetical protein